MTATTGKTAWSTGILKARVMNTAILLVALVGILLLVNVVGYRFHDRVDLTQNSVNTLSQHSIELLGELLEAHPQDILEARVYISSNLPEKLRQENSGREITTIGLEQKLLDKLGEFQTHAKGRLVTVRVQDNINEEASKAGLIPLVTDEATVKAYSLEPKKYYFGVTFHFAAQKQTVPQAIEPGEFEYEFTRALVRLKDSVQDATRIAPMARAAQELLAAVDECQQEFLRFQKSDAGASDTGIAGLIEAIHSEEDEIKALVQNRDELLRRCAKLSEAALKARASFAGRHKRFDRLLVGDGDPTLLDLSLSEEALRQNLRQMPVGGVFGAVRGLWLFEELSMGDTPNMNNIKMVKMEMAQVKDQVQQLKEFFDMAAGQRTMGFVCGHGEFCPFRSDFQFADPFAMNPQVAQALAQQKPQLPEILQRWRGIQDQVNQMLEMAGRSNFFREDYDIERIDAKLPIPDTLAALVLFGPRDLLSDLERYHIDQHLMAGGTLIVFVDNFDVELQMFSEEKIRALNPMDPNQAQPEPGNYGITAVTHNLEKLLAPYGIEVRKDLVLDGTRPGEVRLPFTDPRTRISYQKKFNYPLVVEAVELDREHRLMRDKETLVFPYVSSLAFLPVEGAELEATHLARSGTASVRVDVSGDTKMPLEPEALMEWVKKQESTGPQTLAMAVHGTFKSAFTPETMPALPDEPDDSTGEETESDVNSDAETKAATEQKKKEQKAQAEERRKQDYKAAGKGRILVLGSRMGLPPIAVESVFKNLNPFQIEMFNGDRFLPEVRLLNMVQLRNMRDQPHMALSTPFVLDAFRWGAQPAQLGEIRARHNEFRPLNETDESEQTWIKVVYIGGLPLLVILLGLTITLLRRVRRRRWMPAATASAGNLSPGTKA